MTDERNQNDIAHILEPAIANDYPAAHSMDSTWFAVDAEGNVASFRSGEAGAMPDQAFMEESFEEGEAASEFLSQTEYVIEIEDLLVEPDGNIYSQKAWNEPDYVKYNLEETRSTEYGCLLWLKDDSFFETEYANRPKKWLSIFQRSGTPMQFFRIPHPEAILGFIETIPTTVLAELQREGAFHKCWIHFNFDPSRLGFFSYSHGDMFENWISGPYSKECEPKIPIKLDQLPEALRKQIGAVQMENANFKTDRTIQPFEHAPSGGWQAQCIDSNGVTHEVEDLSDAE